jgi:hypothetical protein
MENEFDKKAEALLQTKRDLCVFLEEERIAEAKRGRLDKWLEKYPQAIYIGAGFSALLAGLAIVQCLRLLGR